MTTNQSSTVGLPQLARYFLRLGIIGFGGPPAHIALMRTDLVDKRHWVTPAQFNDDLATANLLPGPTSTEMTIYIGHRLAGVKGAVVAGACFILPAFFIVLALSIAYVQFNTTFAIDKLLYAIKPVSLALIVNGTVLLGRPVMKGWREWALLIASIALILLAPVDVLLLFVLAGAALLLLTEGAKAFGLGSFFFMPLAQSAGDPVLALQLFWTFLKIGVLIYGGGFALVGILQQEVVLGNQWITQQQLLDGIAIGQSTPGPVFTTVTFVGYLVAGLPGAVLATVGIFLPAFVFVVLENKLFAGIKQNALVQVFLRGVNVSVVATIAVSAGQLSRSALIDPFTVVIFVAALAALMRFKMDAMWLIGIALLIGIIRFLLF
jgi:chromate transporter